MIRCRRLCENLLKNCYLCQSVLADQSSIAHINQKRHFRVIPFCNAGHSHWENIRHIKSAKDHARSKIFSELSRKIAATIKDGGGNDPKKNSELARILKICKLQNMPRATIDKSLNLKHNTQEFIYGVSGPGGSSIVIACQSTTPLNAKHAMLHALKLSSLNGELDQSKVDEFTRKRIIMADVEGREMDDDSATEIALSVGAEEVQILRADDGLLLEFICDAKGFTAVENAIESEVNLTIISSKLEYLPNVLIDLGKSEQTAVEIFFTALQKSSEKKELLFEVTDFYHNIKDGAFVF